MHACCCRHIMVILDSGFHPLQQSGVCVAHYQPKEMQLYSLLLNFEAWLSGWRKKQQHPLCPLGTRMEPLPVGICLSHVTINRRHLSVISVWFHGWIKETTKGTCFQLVLHLILNLLCLWILSLNKHVNWRLLLGSFLILTFVGVVPQPNSDSRRLSQLYTSFAWKGNAAKNNRTLSHCTFTLWHNLPIILPQKGSCVQMHCSTFTVRRCGPPVLAVLHPVALPNKLMFRCKACGFFHWSNFIKTKASDVFLNINTAPRAFPAFAFSFCDGSRMSHPPASAWFLIKNQKSFSCFCLIVILEGGSRATVHMQVY